MTSQRDIAIDMMKGIAIIAVIVGHLDVCINLSGDIVYKVINRLIYSFHMPLFFIVAGYFYRGRGLNIWKDFKRLIVPYFFTAFSICIFIVLYSTVTNTDNIHLAYHTLEATFWGSGWPHGAPIYGNIPTIGAIWFLLALFWAKQAFALLDTALKRVEKNKQLFFLGIGSLILSLIFTYLDNHVIYIPMGVNQGVSAIIFYYIGYCYKTLNKNMDLSIVLYVCLFIILINLPFSSIGLAICFYRCYPLNVLGASATTWCIYKLCRDSKLINKKVVMNFLSWCGRNSLLILCVHLFYLKTMYIYPEFELPILYLTFSLSFALVGAWLLSKILFVKYIFQIK